IHPVALVTQEPRVPHLLGDAQPFEERLDAGMQRLARTFARKRRPLDDRDVEAGGGASDRRCEARWPAADDGYVAWCHGPSPRRWKNWFQAHWHVNVSRTRTRRRVRSAGVLSPSTVAKTDRYPAPRSDADARVGTVAQFATFSAVTSHRRLLLTMSSRGPRTWMQRRNHCMRSMSSALSSGARKRRSKPCVRAFPT